MSVSAMKHLSVFVYKNETEALIRCLMDLRCVELREVENDNEESGRSESDLSSVTRTTNDIERAELESKISTLENAIKLLAKYSDRKKGFFPARPETDLDAFRTGEKYEKTWAVVNKALEDDTKLSELKNLRARNSVLIHSLEPWLDYDLPLSDEGTKKAGIMLGALPSSADFGKFCNELSEVAAFPEKVYSDKSGLYVSITYLHEDEEELSRLLSERGFIRSSFKDINTNAKKASNAAFGSTVAADKKEADIKAELHELAKSIGDVEALCDVERTNLVVASSEQKTGMTEYCCLIEGWVPAEKETKVTKLLEKYSCAYDIREAREDEDPPVLLKNNKFSSTFEWVVGMYSYPKYGTFDPTCIMSIFYFLLFGLMFADVGYGLILVLGGLVLPHFISLKPSMKRSFYMFGFCGISSIIMGVLFGGWFGDLPYAIMENFLGIANPKEVIPFFNGLFINPIDDIMTFFIVALAAGGVHLVAGMIVSMVLECRKGNIVGAIFDTGSWLVIFAGIGVAALYDMTIGVITAVVGVLMIVTMHGRSEKNILMRFLKGLLGLYDVTSYASDLLSYARILALGLASAVISQVVNLLGTMNGFSVVGVIMFIVIMAVGHLLNIAINVLGTFVHTSRLQYLEFFGKFFTAGGKIFDPVAPSEKYTTNK